MVTLLHCTIYLIVTLFGKIIVFTINFILFVQLGGGYLFGLPIGIIADSIGATMGAVAAFLLGGTVSFALVYSWELEKSKTTPIVYIEYSSMKHKLQHIHVDTAKVKKHKHKTLKDIRGGFWACRNGKYPSLLGGFPL